MYERMLDKKIIPSFEDMLTYCGESGTLWKSVDENLKSRKDIVTLIRFPYGNSYGWSVKYSKKSKLICDIFAEKDAFMVLMRISNIAIEAVYESLGDYAKKVCDEKYPCGEGGWLNYRITKEEQENDFMKLLDSKLIYK